MSELAPARSAKGSIQPCQVVVAKKILQPPRYDFRSALLGRNGNQANAIVLLLECMAQQAQILFHGFAQGIGAFCAVCASPFSKDSTPRRVQQQQQQQQQRQQQGQTKNCNPVTAQHIFFLCLYKEVGEKTAAPPLIFENPF